MAGAPDRRLSLLLEVDARLTLGRLALRVRFALDAERAALWGPSAAGKSTLLRVIAGLQPFAGRVRLDRVELALPPGKRPVGLLAQGAALFPHLSAEQNVRFGLRALARPEREARVDEVCALLGLDPLRTRRPESLSGGERQRVALARSLVRRPRLLLLDEPFSALDVRRKAELWALLDGYLRAHGMASLLVSHDPAEVWRWAAHVVRLEAGEVTAEGPPSQVLGEEKNLVLEQFGAGGKRPARGFEEMREGS